MVNVIKIWNADKPHTYGVFVDNKCVSEHDTYTLACEEAKTLETRIMSNRVLKTQLVMRNSTGAVLNRSDIIQNYSPDTYPDEDAAIVDIIREWSRVGFAVGDSFTIEEVK